MEWLLVVMAFGYHAAPALGDGGYTSEALCKGAGQAVVSRLNAREQTEQRNRTKVTGGAGGGGDTVSAYAAKSWAFECIEVRKH